jgi:hypothetical protein
MPESFTLSLPGEQNFSQIAADVASKYIELAGGSAADAQALAAAVVDAMTDVAGAGGMRGKVACEFRRNGGQIDVTVRCHGRARTVTQTVGRVRPQV